MFFGHGDLDDFVFLVSFILSGPYSFYLLFYNVPWDMKGWIWWNYFIAIFLFLEH